MNVIEEEDNKITYQIEQICQICQARQNTPPHGPHSLTDICSWFCPAWWVKNSLII